MSCDLPAWMWGDPAKVAERRERDELGCALCQSCAVTMVALAFCDDKHNAQQKGFPTIGHRCRWFRERES